jgi:hypothetical protein
MGEHLSIDLMLATLLVTTFTSVGMLALWIATSPRHWFIRTAAAFALLSPLLLTPAYEPILTFGLVFAIVTCGIAIYRILQRTKFGDDASDATSETRWRFSIKAALAICAYLAITCAILGRVPANTWAEWPVILTATVGVAILTLLAAWVVDGNSTRRSRTTTAFLVLLLLVGGCVFLARQPASMPSIFGFALLAFISVDDQFRSSQPESVVLFVVAAGSFTALIVTLLLVRASCRNDSRPTTSILAKVAKVAWSLLVFGPPMLVLIALARPLPSVDTTLPTPNGYNELANIGKQFRASAMWKEIVANVVDTGKLDAAIAKQEAEFIGLRKALDMPFAIPVHYDLISDTATDEFQSITNLAYVIDAKADALMRAGNEQESFAWRMDNLRLAQLFSRTGVLNHYSRSSAIEGDESGNVYRHLSSMSSSQLKTAIRELADYDRHREPFPKIRARQLVWEVKTNGWTNRIRDVFDNIADSGTVNVYADTIYPLDQAVYRLIQVEMAVRLYQIERDKLPDQLTDLVPNYLPSLPTDPFARGTQTFRYALSKRGFELWSTGPDRKDDGGAPLQRNQYGGNDLYGSGDVNLKDYFDRGEPAEDASGASNAPAVEASDTAAPAESVPSK